MADESKLNLPKKPYFAGLDILRFFASVAVFIWHLQSEFWHKLDHPFTLGGKMGNIAVSFFYVLSGFLLSYLLFTEYEAREKINIKSFFIRRILRIWPLYYFVVIAGFFLYPALIKLFNGYQIAERATLWRYCLFLPNYDVAYYHYPVSPSLGVLWSLGVEEQFYLFLPFFVMLTIRNRPLMLTSVLILTAFSLWYKMEVVTYYDSLSVMYNLHFGILTAIMAFYFRDRCRVFISNAMTLISAIVFICYCAALQTGVDGENPLAKILEVVVFGVLILNFAFNPSLKSFSARRIPRMLEKLGKDYTYSTYLLHEFAIAFTTIILRSIFHWDNFLMYVLCCIFLLAVMVLIARSVIERPVLRLKEKFAILK